MSPYNFKFHLALYYLHTVFNEIEHHFTSWSYDLYILYLFKNLKKKLFFYLFLMLRKISLSDCILIKKKKHKLFHNVLLHYIDHNDLTKF